MLHNPKRILLIEKWTRWIAWLALISGMVTLAFMLVVIANGEIHNTYSYLSGYSSLGFWEKAPDLTRSILPVLITMAQAMFLLGASKAIRFLRGYYEQISE